jgi:hypothetical protein
VMRHRASSGTELKRHAAAVAMYPDLLADCDYRRATMSQSRASTLVGPCHYPTYSYPMGPSFSEGLHHLLEVRTPPGELSNSPRLSQLMLPAMSAATATRAQDA